MTELVWWPVTISTYLRVEMLCLALKLVQLVGACVLHPRCLKLVKICVFCPARTLYEKHRQNIWPSQSEDDDDDDYTGKATGAMVNMIVVIVV